MTRDFTSKVGFAVGTGQCGTTLLYRAMSKEPTVAAAHERNHLLESYHKFCCWNELPVDEEGFLAEKQREIAEDLGWAEFSFESSSQLSLSIPALRERFEARFVLLVRNPLPVVASYVRKGYYQDRIEQRDTSLALGYQPGREFHHYLERVVPRRDEFHRWNALTQVGKVAWFWQALNQRTLELLQELPEAHRAVVRLEDLDFDRYRALTQMFGFDSQLRSDDFETSRQQHRNSSAGSLRLPDWSQKEISEFEQEIGDVATRLGYPTTFEDCVSVTDIRQRPQPKPPRRSFYSRLGLTG